MERKSRVIRLFLCMIFVTFSIYLKNSIYAADTDGRVWLLDFVRTDFNGTTPQIAADDRRYSLSAAHDNVLYMFCVIDMITTGIAQVAIFFSISFLLTVLFCIPVTPLLNTFLFV